MSFKSGAYIIYHAVHITDTGIGDFFYRDLVVCMALLIKCSLDPHRMK